MNIKRNILFAILISFFSLSLVSAATVTLKNGQTFEGEITSQNSETLIIDMNGIEMRIPAADVAAIDLQSGQAKSADTTEQKTTGAKTEAPVTVAAGTAITVRMTEAVNSRNHKTGHRFTAILETNLMSGDAVVAQKGSKVYGVLTNVKKAGRIAGSASMTLELTDISINNVMVAITTHPMGGEGQNTAKTSVGRTARAAAVGGLIGGSDGAKTGAKVGVGAAILSKGDDIEIPNGALIDFILAAPLNR